MASDKGNDPHESSEEGSTGLAPPRKGRRAFLKRTMAAGALGAAVLGGVGRAEEVLAGPRGRSRRGAAAFQSRWPEGAGRVWLGPPYWTNPLQDWRLADDGTVEVVGGGPNRNVHLLTHRLGTETEPLQVRVRVGVYDDRPAGEHGRLGVILGAQGPMEDYRSDAVYGEGLEAGLTTDGQLFVGDEQRALSGEVDGERGAVLEVTAEPEQGGYMLTLSARDPATEEAVGQVQRRVAADRLAGGGVALLASFEGEGEDEEPWGTARGWFEQWEVSGAKVEAYPERAFGPLLFAQHTLSRGTMKMTAQLPPVGAADDDAVRLQTEQGGQWQTVAEAPIDERARTATFRVEDWDDGRDVPYRLAYRHQAAEGLEPSYYEGVVRHDPKEKDDLVVAALSCRGEAGFPHARTAENLHQHDPDLVAFTGDQYYESAGGYGALRLEGTPGPEAVERATLDMLRKWYQHGWAFGEVMRDRPAFGMPDDHDVFQGNVWGAGGENVDRWELHNNGGYLMPAEWVNAVQRTQTAHLPDPPDPTPVKNDIGVYYTDLLYGRVSFAVVEDRKWKSGPDGLVPANPGRPDHVEDPSYDPSALDVPAAELLGARQHAFLDDWGANWQGADMKSVISQTVFAQVPTHHGPDYMYLVADLDSNGWPQTPRAEAVRRMRKGVAFHIGGDQHLPMLLQYGLDGFDDGGYNFCVPPVSNIYPRAFWPSEIPPALRDRFEGTVEGTGGPATERPGPTGRYTDGLGNRVVVRAVANPVREIREGVLEGLQDQSCGYGIIRFHKPSREITMEAWPLLGDPAGGEEEQYAGWPQTIGMMENDGRAAVAYLPTLEVEGATDPVVQVLSEGDDGEDGEVLYTLRIQGTTFRPKVFADDGRYTVRVSSDGGTWQETIADLAPAGEASQETVRVQL